MDCENALDKQISLLREYYQIGIFPNSVKCLCNECDGEMLKFTILNNLGYEQIHFNNLGIDEPFHRASLVGFNTDNGPRWFIVDPTYGQFFSNKKFCSYVERNCLEFGSKLLKNGYIECNLSNIFYYFSSFIYSGAYSRGVDEYLVFDNINKLLIGQKIIKKSFNFKCLLRSKKDN